MSQLNLQSEFAITDAGVNTEITEEQVKRYMQNTPELFSKTNGVSLIHLIFNLYDCKQQIQQIYLEGKEQLQTDDIPGCAVLGAYFYTKEDIKVPSLPRGSTVYTKLEKGSIKYVKVLANSYFVLTYLECLLFLSQPKYAMTVKYKNTKKSARLILRWDTLVRKSSYFPSPYFRVEGITLFNEAQPLYIRDQESYEFNKIYDLDKVLKKKFGHLPYIVKKLQKKKDNPSDMKGVRNILMLQKLLNNLS